MDFKDYYATLGVAKTASEKDVKQAFRKLARKYHPDVNPNDKVAETKFKEVNEANEVLSNPDTRKKYDELGANWRMYERAQPESPSPFGGTRAPGAGGFRTMTPEEAAEMFGEGGSPFSDFFRTFFGEQAAPRGRARPQQRRPRVSHDVEHEIELSLDEAYSGTTRRLTLAHEHGSRNVDVRFPAGVREGSRVRVPGEGASAGDGGPWGDLYLRVRLAPHPNVELKGRDLHATARVHVTTAVLGGEAEVTTLGGKTARLRVPPLTQNGQVFRLKGYGMPVAGKPAETGDLYARVAIQLPTQLTADEREHYEALARLAGDTVAAGSTRKGTS